MTFLQLDNIKKTFGELSVIKGVNISASKGEFVVFVAPRAAASPRFSG